MVIRSCEELLTVRLRKFKVTDFICFIRSRKEDTVTRLKIYRGVYKCNSERVGFDIIEWKIKSLIGRASCDQQRGEKICLL